MEQEKALAKIALKATPYVLKSLDAGELVKPICGVIKTIGCKDQIALTNAISALGPETAAVSKQFVETLNETMQIYMQSNCKDYSLIVQAVIDDPVASIQEKVEYVSLLKAQQSENTLRAVKTYTNQACKAVLSGAAAIAMVAVASQSPKISGDIAKMVESHEKTKRTKARMKGLVEISKKGKTEGEEQEVK